MANKMESIDLKKLIKGCEGEYQDNTDYIRRVKHSESIRNDIIQLNTLKTEQAELWKTAPLKFTELAQTTAFFLFKNYTDIFNKVIKDELDMDIMYQTLDILRKIENNEVDQNEGSILVGKLLKELYVDSALKLADKLDSEYAKPEKNEGQKISWAAWKNKRYSYRC